MAKEIYIYTPIYDLVAETFAQKMEENKSEDVLLKVNSPGGRLFYAWSMVAKMAEHEGKVTVRAEGHVASAGILFLLYASQGMAESLDVTQFMIHRATMFVENESDKALLATINKDMQKRLNGKIDNVKLKELKGYTVDELFAAEERIDLWLTAKEAKQVGLIDRITKLTPQEAEAFNNKLASVAAELPNNPTPNKMTLEELKTKHPEVYNQAVAIGVTQEHDRVCAWLAFAQVDTENVVKSIKEKAVMSQSQMVELALKGFSAGTLKNIKEDTTQNVVTAETAAGTKEKNDTVKKEVVAGQLSQEQLDKYQKDIFSHLNLKTEKQ